MPRKVQPATYVTFDYTAIVVTQSNPYPLLSGQWVQVNFYYSNKKSSIAHDVIADGAAQISEDGPNKQWEDKQFRSLRSQVEVKCKTHVGVQDLVLGDSRWFTKYTRELSDADVNELRDGKKLLYVFGLIGWKDDTGNHETELCSSLQPPGDAPIWHDCMSGHNVIR